MPRLIPLDGHSEPEIPAPLPRRRARLVPLDAPTFNEDSFQRDYKSYASKQRLSPNPDDPEHFYNYRGYYKKAGGFYPDAEGHLPSEFKTDGHPRMVVDGINTKTGMPPRPSLPTFASKITRKAIDPLIPDVPKSASEAVDTAAAPFNPKTIDTPTSRRVAGDITAGAVDTVGGMGGATAWLGRRVNSPMTERIGQAVASRAQSISKEMTPDNPNFVDSVMRGFGSTATFFLPGVGVARGAGALASVAPRLATWLGISASSVLEGLVEAGSNYNEAYGRTGNEQEASSAATKTFLANLPLLFITNRFGLFGDKVLGAGLSEGGQEFLQEVIGNIALHDEPFKNAVEAGLVGAISGGGIKGISNVLGQRDPEIQKMVEAEMGKELPKAEKSVIREVQAVAKEEKKAEALKVKSPKMGAGWAVQEEMLEGEPFAFYKDQVAVTQVPRGGGVAFELYDADANLLGSYAELTKAREAAHKFVDRPEADNDGDISHSDFLKSIGKINPKLGQSSDILEIDRPDLIDEESGKSLDHAAEAFIEAGRLPPGSTGSDLIQLIQKEAGKQVSPAAEMEKPLDKMSDEEIDAKITGFQEVLGAGKLRKADQLQLSTFVQEKARRSEFRRTQDEDEFAAFSKAVEEVKEETEPTTEDTAGDRVKEEREYNDLVRASYAGTDARRQLNALPPSLRSDVVGFSTSGIKPTPKNVEKWLADHGTIGAVDHIVKDILKYHKAATAERRGGEASETLAQQAAREVLRKNKIDDRVAVSVVDSIEVDDSAFGEGYGREYNKENERAVGVTKTARLGAVIELTRDATKATGRHEAFHAVTNLLLNQSEKGTVLKKYENMEKAADAFGEFAGGKTTGDTVIDRIFKTIMEFLERMGNYLESKGFKSADDVFRAIDKGELGERAKGEIRRTTEYSAKPKPPTETEAFKKWFGSSRVVDENGKPLVVYHGSPENFKEFDHSKIGRIGTSEGKGFYFTPERSRAYGYVDRGDGGKNGKVYEVYLSIQKPMSLTQNEFTAEMRRKIFLEIEKSYPDALSNYGEISYYGKERVLREAIEANKELNDLDFISSQINGGIGDMSTVYSALKKLTGYDGVFSSAKESGQTSDVWVAFLPTQIKSASGNRGTFDPKDARIQYSVTPKKAPAFFSGLQKLLEEKMPERAFVPQVRSIIANGKQEEVKWSGIDQFLEGKAHVSKKDLLEFLRANEVQVKEVVKGNTNQLTKAEQDRLNELAQKVSDFKATKAEEKEYRTLLKRDNADFTSNATKFSSYQLPGGENYRELLLTLSERGEKIWEIIDKEGLHAGWLSSAPTENERNVYEGQGFKFQEKVKPNNSDNFASSHFDEPNILAHVRFNERKDAEGKKVLFIEELQSDWGQAKRNEKDVPDAPFVGKTESWMALSLKRMLRFAAENGYERIAWTTGEQQAERYDLSKQIDFIEYHERPDGTYDIDVFKDGQDVTPAQMQFGLAKEDIQKYLGKDIAEKISKGEGVKQDVPLINVKRLEGENLKVGGEGMRGFYDVMIPSFLNKYAKRWGARVGQTELTSKEIPSGNRSPRTTLIDVHSLDITPSMKRDVLEVGQPQYAVQSKEPEKASQGQIAKAQILRNSLKIGETDWTALKWKETRKKSLTEMNKHEVSRIIETLNKIKREKITLSDYLSDKPQAFKGAEPDRLPAALTEGEKFFGVTEPFPRVEFPIVGEKAGNFRNILDVAGARSRGRILRDAGEAGEVFIKEIQQARELPSYKAGEYNDALKKIEEKTKLTPDEIFNLKESLEGRAKPESERVKEYFDEIDRQRKKIQSVRQQQLEENQWQLPLEIKRKQSELWGIKDYFHHHIPQPDDLLEGHPLREDIVTDMVKRGVVNSKKSAEAMVDEYVNYVKHRTTPLKILTYLVDTRQAANIEDAALKLARARQFSKKFTEGAFEPREIDLPFYDPNPLRVVPQYNKAALKHIYHIERFGQNAERLLALVEKIDQAGGNKKIADTVLDGLLGRNREDDDGGVMQAVRSFQAIEKMSYSGISNYFQGVLGISITMNPVLAIKTKWETIRHAKEASEWARRVGQNADMALLFHEDVADWTKRFLSIVQFRRTELNNYVFATTAGKLGAIHFFKELKADPKNALARRKLVQLGVEVEAALKNGVLSELDLVRAADRAWRESQGIADIFKLPHRWLGVPTNSEFGRTWFQFKTVAYSQTRIIYENVFKELAKGRIAPLLTFLILFPAAGEIVEGLKAFLKRKERTSKGFERYLENMGAAFGYGILNDLVWLGRLGVVSVGPTLTQLGELSGAAYEIFPGRRSDKKDGTKGKRQWTYTKKSVKNIPIIGHPIYNAMLKDKERKAPAKPENPFKRKRNEFRMKMPKAE